MFINTNKIIHKITHIHYSIICSKQQHGCSCGSTQQMAMRRLAPLYFGFQGQVNISALCSQERLFIAMEYTQFNTQPVKFAIGFF